MDENTRRNLISGLMQSVKGDNESGSEIHLSVYNEGTGTLYIKDDSIDLKTAVEAIAQLERHIKRLKEAKNPQNEKKIMLYQVGIACIKKLFNLPLDPAFSIR